MKESTESLNFIEHIIEEDLANGFAKDNLRFRFPPEPNGYLHIGHAASICLNFGLGEKYNAPVNLRFDDTNPAKEEQEYVDAIKRDIAWLGFKWAKECYSSDYFQQLYDWAIQLIKEGKAYVDQQSSEQIAAQKGTPTSPGSPSPYRDRSVEENLDLFEKMKNGEFEAGSYLLRAKIDMASPNMHMRDPILYRIINKAHHRTGTEWCIYPMYDWAHGQSDYVEQVSHSLCTLEFKAHRELYDWYLDQIYDSKLLRPKQREFARRNLSFTVMSKRKLLELVQKKIVAGWDDPRMPTISGLRRRGYTPDSIRKFSDVAGISKRDNVTEVSLLEFCIREDLNKTATRVMGVLNPVKLIITNYPEGKSEILEMENNPELPNSGTHEVPFSRELYIEREDFKEEAGKKFFRLSLGNEVRLKSAYIIKAESVKKDENGNILEIHCTYDADSRSGSGTEASQRKVKGTLHWVSIAHAIKAEVREYDRLFLDEAPDSHEDKNFLDFVNPDSLKIIKEAYLEPYLANASMDEKFQFQRLGYFSLDPDSKSDALVFNKTVGLKDTWAKQNIENPPQNQPKQPQTQTSNQGKRKALNEIQQISKKLTNFSGEKLNGAMSSILELAEEVSYEELSPLFNTAAKKVGTRIGVMLTLSVLLNKGQERNAEIDAFIQSGLEDEHEILKAEAQKLV
ncbi:glutaminyl-tRNA synthetase [Algoriphagus faecimaris]|uniref:Glutamine--tRNA ligase n=1 Tax=Algoriphagus faecimaris TaxID=686796 RepID=A0A1G6PMU3_9BACT|nr:glutamine--tRNA ligase/YqeY domain fusion protein [Algoriphagus faecimaris]SDC80665.1 glutaminyl-tRNA synthetase [Algoriphagus faecimaris]